MPKQYKFVCFKHRHVSKRSGSCPTCQTELYCVGDRAKIPRKGDDTGWKHFKEWIMLRRNYDPEARKPLGPLDFSERYNQADADKIGRK